MGIRESCDCIPYIVSHTLLHNIPAVEYTPNFSRRRYTVVIVDDYCLNMIERVLGG